MLKSLFFKEKEIKELTNIESIRQNLSLKEGLLWVDIEDPSEADINVLMDDFAFHPLAIEDCIFPQNHSKLEDFGDHIFLVIHSICNIPIDKGIKTNELDIFISENYIVTVHENNIKCVNSLIDRCKSNPSLMYRGSDYLLYLLLDTIVDNYFPVIDSLDDRIEKIETDVLQRQDTRVMQEIFSIKKAVIDLRKVINPQQTTINTLSRRDFPFMKPELAIYFRDISDNIFRMFNLLETYRDILSTAIEVHVSVVSNRLNEIMKTLTIIATFMMPLTLITSFYGMNIYIPEVKLGVAGYFIVWGIIVATVAAMFIFFKRRKWL